MWSMTLVADRDKSTDNPQTNLNLQSEGPVHLSLVAIEKEGLVKLAASGSITADNFDPTGKNPLERLLGENWSTFRVILDMRQTTYIDSSAIGWLIGSHKAFKSGGGAMILHDVPVNIRQMLELLHVDKVIPIAANAQAARGIVTGGQQ
jgi:stage II sporulation protein AA (anti-sigma F factor antagonist)